MKHKTNKLLLHVIFVTVVLLGSLLIVNCGESLSASEKKEEKTDQIPVKVITVEAKSFTDYSVYYGKVSGIEEAELLTVMGGHVDQIFKKEGDFVRAGASLGRINSESIASQLEAATLAENLAYDDYNRQKRFLQSGNSSQVKVNSAHLTWLQAKSRRIEAEKAYKGALCITPISGTVVSKNITLYEELRPGAATFTVANLDKLKIKIGVPENEMPGIKVGSDVEVTFSIAPDQVMKGTIFAIGRKTSKSSLTFPIEIHVDNPGNKIYSGVTANVKLFKANYKDAVVVPINAVLSKDDENYVMTVVNNKAKKKIVELGHINDTMMVISNGLTFGDVLILEGNHIVTDDSAVRIIN